MQTFLYTELAVICIVILFWLWLMNRLKPRHRYDDETWFEANKREGGFSVLLWFLVMGFFAGIGIAKLILYFNAMENISNIK